MPHYAGVAAPLVASVSADTAEEFAAACEALSLPGVAAIEANISCPNIEADGTRLRHVGEGHLSRDRARSSATRACRSGPS